MQVTESNTNFITSKVTMSRMISSMIMLVQADIILIISS